jgi:hypothetical protein
LKGCNLCHQALPAAAFYRDPRAKDGLASTCKICERRRARAYRDSRTDQAREQERARWKTPESKARHRARRAKSPQKSSARAAVQRAISAGRLARQPCEVCGSEVAIHAHHDDYSKPLEVRWLCEPHHIEHHAQELRRAAEERDLSGRVA